MHGLISNAKLNGAQEVVIGAWQTNYTCVLNYVSAAPGFTILRDIVGSRGAVHVIAGVPSVFRAMLAHVLT
jgi:molybdopterin-biosynthesis enzyme MoeA-like protein